MKKGEWWFIEGKPYDLTPFVEHHPGGKEMILLGKGVDCTAMVHSVHFNSFHQVSTILRKYQVETKGDLKQEHYPSFKTGDFYFVLKKKVENKLGRNYKANWVFWMKGLFLILSYAFFLYDAIITANLFSGMIAGILNVLIGFNIFHDASHGAISKNKWVNNLYGRLWSCWAFWNHFLWLQHHVWGHHSFTGEFGKDPDVVHTVPFVRKSSRTRWRTHFQYQYLFTWPFHVLFPGQYVGQTLMYWLSLLTKHLFGMKTRKHVKMEWIDLLMYAFALGIQIVPLLYLHKWDVSMRLELSILLGSNLCYFLLVFPNHDQHSTETLKRTTAANYQKYEDIDWGIQQVVSSANVLAYPPSVTGMLLAYLSGGMFFQIEHHLFPSVNHCHYWKIAPLVQETCREFGIEYTSHSLLETFHQYYLHMKQLGQPNQKNH